MSVYDLSSACEAALGNLSLCETRIRKKAYQVAEECVNSGDAGDDLVIKMSNLSAYRGEVFRIAREIKEVVDLHQDDIRHLVKKLED